MTEYPTPANNKATKYMFFRKVNFIRLDIWRAMVI
jgi:hypothetical protein